MLLPQELHNKQSWITRGELGNNCPDRLQAHHHTQSGGCVKTDPPHRSACCPVHTGWGSTMRRAAAFMHHTAGGAADSRRCHMMHRRLPGRLQGSLVKQLMAQDRQGHSASLAAPQRTMHMRLRHKRGAFTAVSPPGSGTTPQKPAPVRQPMSTGTFRPWGHNQPSTAKVAAGELH